MNRDSGGAHIAVAGCGAWGRNLVRVFHELGALAAVVETGAEGVVRAREIAPGVPVLDSLDAALADPAIAAVVIATPAETHTDLAVRAMEAGKDVFVEKPMALTFSDGETLVRLARERERVLMVGHILEYHPAVEELLSRVRAGDFGNLRYLYSNRLNLGKIRREENILWSFAPHDIAVLLRLVGEEPFEVAAAGGSYLQPNIADVTMTTLLFNRGIRAHIFVSWLHPFKEQKLVVVGSKRMAVFDDVSPDRKLVIYDQGIDIVNGEPQLRKNAGEVIALPAVEPLRAEALHFLRCVEKRETPRTDGSSGLRVVRVLQAAQRSLSSHGQPLSLQEGERKWEPL